MGIIILDSVRIEAYEFHVAHDKREVLIPKDFTKYLVAITDHVVITDQPYVRQCLFGLYFFGTLEFLL